MKLEDWREIEDFENEVDALKFLHARLEGARKNRNGLGGVEIDYLQKLVKANMVNVEAVEKLKKFSRIMDCKRFSKIYPTTALEDEGIEKLKKLSQEKDKCLENKMLEIDRVGVVKNDDFWKEDQQKFRKLESLKKYVKEVNERMEIKEF